MQDLNKFKNEMNLSGKNVYVGHRYGPVLDDGGWDKTKEYEPLTIIQYQGDSYVSRTWVPKEVDISNKDYWYSIGVYNAQVASLRNKSETIELDLNNLKNDVNNEFVPLLQKTYKRTTIIPDDFEGTDLEKVQKAYDNAVAKGITDINLNRTYDLTGGSVYLENGSFPSLINFNNGKLIKNDTGFMFTREEGQTNNTNSPSFMNVSFEGNSNADVYIIDGDKMIRTKAILCKFNYISLIKTVSYTQSLRLYFNVVYYQTNSFIKSNQNLDLDIAHNEFETSNNHLIETITDNTTQYANNSFRFNNNLVEGYITKVPIVTSSGVAFNIINNYFEKNNGHIKFVNSGGLKNVAGTIDNNYFMNNLYNYDIEFNTHIANRLSVNNNTSNIKGVDKALISNVVAETKNNNLYASGYTYPIGTRYLTIAKKINEIAVSGDNGLTFKITMDITRADGLLGKSYLLTTSATHGSSVNYRANYVGVLTFIGYYDTTQAKVRTKALLKHISLSGVGGNTTGLDGVDGDVVVTFGHNGLNNCDPTDTLTTVDINFNKLTYNAAYTTINFKPIEDILVNGYTKIQ